MEVILTKDVSNLGYTDDIVKVKPGYGRNFLIPQGLAVIANETNKKIHTENLKQRAHKIAAIKEAAEKTASVLESIVLTVKAKAGENGKLFGSVTSAHLSDVLKKMGYEIDRKQIVMPSEQIRSVGTYTSEILLHRDVRTKVNFEVSADS
ncbi:MAG TPA: 50S ribosomal protein L9 [Bacteroidia bacterium]|nr:50S ribosomal protein L9 [Bacteroidia bacterium]